jgi:hypothetical protein
MADKPIPDPNDRCLLIRSKMADGYEVSVSGMKGIQHTLTDWFPRAVYADLTPDTVAVDIEVRKDYLSNRSLFGVKFIAKGGEVLKSSEYAEDRIIGKTCPYYDAKKGSYAGKRDGFDCRLVYYSPAPVK